MARKPVEEEQSGYNWMDTYGDMVTLLLCVFVLLYSFSSIDGKKWKELVAAFTGESSSSAISVIEMSNHDVDVVEPPLDYRDINKRKTRETKKTGGADDVSTADGLYMSIKNYIEKNNMQGSMSVARTEEVIYLRFNEIALFESGKAEILSENEEAFGKIMRLIHTHKSLIRGIRIEGHTDNVPIHTPEFSDNWDLSVKRATNVLRQVLSYGYFGEETLSAVGYGEFHPIATNDTAEGRAQNSR